MSISIYLECDHCGSDVFEGNVTYNLTEMVRACGLGKVWDAPNGTPASDLTQDLRDGLAELNAHPEKYEPMNPLNGWGSYSGLVAFVGRYLAACLKYPDAGAARVVISGKSYPCQVSYEETLETSPTVASDFLPASRCTFGGTFTIPAPPDLWHSLFMTVRDQLAFDALRKKVAANGGRRLDKRQMRGLNRRVGRILRGEL